MKSKFFVLLFYVKMAVSSKYTESVGNFLISTLLVDRPTSEFEEMFSFI